MQIDVEIILILCFPQFYNILLCCLKCQDIAHADTSSPGMSENSFDEDNLTNIRPHFSVASSGLFACAANFHVHSIKTDLSKCCLCSSVQKLEHSCLIWARKLDTFEKDCNKTQSY